MNMYTYSMSISLVMFVSMGGPTQWSMAKNR